MLNKFSRKSISVFAIACLIVSVVCLWRAESGNAYTAFNGTQYLSITSDGWNITCESNYTTGAWFCHNWFYSDNTISYSSPYGSWKEFFLYEWATGRYVEAILTRDRQL